VTLVTTKCLAGYFLSSDKATCASCASLAADQSNILLCKSATVIDSCITGY